MNPLCSACIPTRKRFNRLIKTLTSIRLACDDPDSFELLLRVDDDDEETKFHLPKLREQFGVRDIIGPRYEGYNSMGQFVTELSDIAQSPWIFIIDDDATVQGTGLDRQLRKVLVHEHYVAVCEWYKLNNSTYRGALPVGMFVPNKCWNMYGIGKLLSPVDEFLRTLLVNDHGWKVNLLPGLTYVHEWEEPTQKLRQEQKNNP